VCYIEQVRVERVDLNALERLEVKSLHLIGHSVSKTRPDSALRRAAQRRQQIGWRGQAGCFARPGGNGDQAEKGNDERREDRRGDYAMRKKRDDAAIFIGLIGVVVVRAGRVRALRRMFTVAMNPPVSRGA
jgi:hypothetical protein